MPWRHLRLATRARLIAISSFGMGHLLVGVVLLAAGVGVTLTSTATVWYGAIAVGAIESARGLYLVLGRRRRR